MKLYINNKEDDTDFLASASNNLINWIREVEEELGEIFFKSSEFLE